MSDATPNNAHPSPRRKCGDTREDGMIFFCYRTGGGEYWLSPEKWQARKAKSKATRAEYDKNNRERVYQAGRKWRAENPERHLELKRRWNLENKEKACLQAAAWRKANPGKGAEYGKRKYEKNKEAILAKNKAYRQRNKEAIQAQKREYMRQRRKEHAPYAIQMRIRGRFGNAMKRKGWRKDSPMQAIVGCSWEELKAHLESYFHLGFSWETRSLWHIDHIIPCNQATTEEEMKKLFHYTNLQPLWILDNLKKADKLDPLFQLSEQTSCRSLLDADVAFCQFGVSPR